MLVAKKNNFNFDNFSQVDSNMAIFSLFDLRNDMNCVWHAYTYSLFTYVDTFEMVIRYVLREFTRKVSLLIFVNILSNLF